MGLRVSVYKNVKLVEKGEYDFQAFTLQGFEDRIKNLVWQGKYKAESNTTYLSYPYSTHNQFRDELCLLIGKDKRFYDKEFTDEEKNLPFYELLDFADNEGNIDAESAANLYEDFLQYKELALQTLGYKFDEYYVKWIDCLSAGREKNSVIHFS